MRLKEIKLAGFKSFVDPTTVVLPGNRVAVVGPNGCGKSNVIDAVRWVMGESSARQLRGEALTDVIFNGSNARRPTSLASVELLFDNRDGRVGGKFASYAELAIRREVDRNSQSIYYLNGSRCRRRDIADVFLGTGFGPRSYSIIEQGMIADLVEAKPDELRTYLEEAAGVSKYRERRRETQNRIRNTLENLDRLRDIREEVERALALLKKQAKAAERYRELKDEERRLAAELQVLRLTASEARLAEQGQTIGQLTVQFEKAQSVRQALETTLEEQRGKHAEHAEEHNRAQANQYEANARASKLEQAIRFARARIEDHQRELQSLAGRSEEVSRQLAEDAASIAAAEDKIEAQQRIELARQGESEHAAKAVEELESRANARQREWEEFGKNASQNDSELRVCADRIEQGERLGRELQTRLAKSREQAPTLVDTGIDDLAHEVDDASAAAAALGADIDVNGRALTAKRERTGTLEREVAKLRGTAQRQRRELAATEALQEAALGRDAGDSAIEDWIDANDTRSAPRLGETLEVDAGWESAVELVLGSNVRAMVVANVDAFCERLGDLESGRLMLLDGTATGTKSTAALPLLADFVRGKLGSLGAGVLAAQTTAEALAVRPNLKPGESIVTRDGLWLGPDWIRLERASQEDGRADSMGAIQREKELASRRASAEAADARLRESEAELAKTRRQTATLDVERESLRRRHAEATDLLAKLRTEYELRRARAREAAARAQRIAAEQEDLQTQIQRESEQLQAVRARLTELQARSATLRVEEQQLRDARVRGLGELAEARKLSAECNESYQQSRRENAALQAKLAASATARDRLIEQRKEIDVEAGRARAASAQLAAELPAQEKAHQVELGQGHEIERELRRLRAELDAIEVQIGELSAQRTNAEQAVEAVRSNLDDARLERERLTAKRDSERAAFAEIGITEQDARDGLPADASEEHWLERLAGIGRRLERLGPINLAAIDEYQTQSERKEYLDRQNADLEKALATLQSAIQRIDRDTRVRFKDTFEQLNENLGKLFPKVFGGGHAALVLTSDDWLETGVALTAQPPGKRNSSIQSLSGGEKAMAAVALIFSIFQLNPSPVCLLDEVDAPLDDNNVQRFAELIGEMSADVQFVVITHNKQTIEMADHLLGVTMQEAGVSRLVSVDVDQAARLAAAG